MAAERCVVFARIQPDQKRALVEALVKNGKRVAMVGDGVNDVPALKASQVAIALGSGSQIAKGVADLVLVGPQLRGDPGRRRGGAQDPAERPARRQAVRREVGVRRRADPDGRHRGRRLPVPAAPALACRRLHRRASDVLPRARAAPARAARPGLPARHPRVRDPRRHRARPRRPARARTRARRAQPLAGRVADDVDDDPDLRRAVPRARARVDRHAHLAAPRTRDPRALHRCSRRSTSRSSRSAPARGYFALAPPSALPVLVSIICTIFAIGALGAIGLSLTRPGGERVQLVVPFRRSR